MPRLVVYRGETLVKALDLARLPLTIGRAPGNDLILEDPVKSVSREHAQIRLEGGRYVLVDNQSENGTWLAGRRLSSITFTPGTIVTIGPFRLTIDGLPASEVPPTVAVSAVQPRRFPTGWPALQRVRAATAGLTPTQWKVAGGTAVALAVMAIGVWAGVIRPARAREQLARETMAAISTAQAQLAGGLCADALGQTIQPALGRDRSNETLQRLKQEAETCLSPPPPPPPQLSEVERILASAREALASGQCDELLAQQIAGVLAVEPENADALAVKAQLDKCRPPVVSVPPTRKPVLAVKIPAEGGGLDPLPDELDRAYQDRVRAMRQRYDLAVAAAVKSATHAAVLELEGIAREVPDRYLDLAATLAAARSSFAAATQRLVAEARGLAGQGRWNDAIQKFNDAKAADPDLEVDGEIRKAQEAKLEVGLGACTRARLLASYDPTEAQRLFRLVLENLPSEHPCYLDARKMLGRQ